MTIIQKGEPMSDLISRQAAITEFSRCELTPDGGIDANYAIDFLKQMPPAQPSVSKTEIVGDVISRQAAINEILDDLKDTSLHDDPATPEDFAEGYDEGIRNAAAIVLQMPSAQPGWIPTSVRLPEEKTGVLITTTKGYVIQCMYWGYQNGRHTWRSLGGEHLYWEMDVLAWCELPIPYREGGQE